MTLDSSADEKLALHGSDNPTIRFREGSNDKGNLHWKASTGEMRLVNEEYSQELRLGQNGVTVTGDLDVTGNLEVTGTTTFNGGTLTLGDSATDNVVFGADVNSSITPNTDGAYDLGSSSKEWRNLYIDGTAYIDVLEVHSLSSFSAEASFSGNVNLGNHVSDNIRIQGRVNSNIVPDADSTYDLGTTALRWSNLFIDAATVTDDVSIGGNLEVIGNANITGTLTYEDVTNIDSVGVVTARSGLVVSSGGANITGGITGDLTGDVTGNADTATTLATSRTLSISSDATGSASFNGGANADIAVTLANSGVTAGTYGSSSAIPAITVDAKGRITSASTSAIDSTSVSNGGESVSVSSGGQITSSANHDFDAGIDVTGNITVTGTVDGRDVATDGSKLDGIESGATADQTAAEIRTLVGSASDSNVFTDADHSKLNGIASGATNVTNNNQLTNGASYITSSANISGTAAGLSGTPNITVGTISCGNITSSGTVTANSDAKLKKNVATVSNALDKVNLLRGVEFDYIADDKHSIGVIAQEVEAVLPDLVHTNEETDTKSVAYSNLTAVLIEAVKELTAEVNTLKAELNTLKGE